MSQPRSYLQFDGMVWPDPRDPTEVQWRLRYGDPTRRDHVRAASVLSAYAHLISMPRRLRDKRIRQLRAAMAANPPGEDTMPPAVEKRPRVSPCPTCGAPHGFHDGPPHTDSLVEAPPPDWRLIDRAQVGEDITYRYVDEDNRPHVVRTKAGSQ